MDPRSSELHVIEGGDEGASFLTVNEGSEESVVAHSCTARRRLFFQALALSLVLVLCLSWFGPYKSPSTEAAPDHVSSAATEPVRPYSDVMSPPISGEETTQTSGANYSYRFVSAKQLQLDIAAEAIRMMQSDTPEAAARSQYVDISDYVDMMNVALDELGIQGLLVDFFSAQEHAVALTEIISQSEELQASNFQVSVEKFSNTITDTIRYRNPPNNGRGLGLNCHGCLYWLVHHLGSIMADKFLREGSLRLNRESDERLSDAPSIIHEMQRLQRMSTMDRASFQTEHGFMWTYMPAAQPNMTQYPLAMAKSFCQNLLYTVEKPDGLDQDIGEKCRHGVGHAVFYVAAQNQLQQEFQVTKPLRPGAGFSLFDEALCQALKMCHQAPNGLALHDCQFGINHSSRLVGPPDLDKNAMWGKIYQYDRQVCKH